MEKQASALKFGNFQTYTSPRLQKRPVLAKLIHNVFGYTNVGSFTRARIIRDLLNEVPSQKFEKVLDIGCGWGEYSFMLAKGLPQAKVTALEVDPPKIQLLRRILQKEAIPNIEPFTGYLSDLDDDGYDFMFSVDVFEHIEESQMPFKDAYDRLKPGGYLMVKMPTKIQRTIMPDGWFEEHQDWLEDEHIGQIYMLEDLVARFEKEGFQVTHAAYHDQWLARLGWEIGYLSHKAGPILQLPALPLAKALVRMDKALGNQKWGNTIQVIGQKPLKK